MSDDTRISTVVNEETRPPGKLAIIARDGHVCCFDKTKPIPQHAMLVELFDDLTWRVVLDE